MTNINQKICTFGALWRGFHEYIKNMTNNIETEHNEMNKTVWTLKNCEKNLPNLISSIL